MDPQDGEGKKTQPIKYVAPLPYELVFKAAPQPQHQQHQLNPPLQYKPQSQQHKRGQNDEMRSIKRKAIVGAVLMMVPIINILGIALLLDALIHYLKTRSHRS
jgi:hypothetical protein